MANTVRPFGIYREQGKQVARLRDLCPDSLGKNPAFYVMATGGGLSQDNGGVLQFIDFLLVTPAPGPDITGLVGGECILTVIASPMVGLKAGKVGFRAPEGAKSAGHSKPSSVMLTFRNLSTVKT